MLTFVRTNPQFPRLVFPAPHRPNRLVCSAVPVRHITAPKSLHDATKFLVLSDLHVRRESASVCVQTLQTAHEEALRRNAAILFLGDFWHTRGALPVEPLNMILKELQSWTVPMLMIPGNHDLISRTGNGVSLVPLATTLGDRNCLLITTPTICLDALFLPYMHEVKKLKEALKYAHNSADNVKAVFCHVEVAGARLADRIISQPSQRIVSPQDFPPQLRVFSGHLHRPHTVSNTITYVGSPYQVSASEQGQQKSLLILDREKDWSIIESIPIDVGPRHFTVSLPSTAQFPQFRNGDRITIQTTDPDCTQVKDAVAELRDHGTRVQLQVLPSENANVEYADEDPFAPAEPRISSSTLSNCDLFEQYATIKSLGAKVIRKGNQLLQDIGARSSSVNTNISGKDVTIAWQSVHIRGFGSFLGSVEYPLKDRGLVLVMGRDNANDGVICGRTNGTGKTTLVMAALWAMTGRTDARPDGSVERGVASEMVHDDAKDCEVTVNLILGGDRVLSLASEMMTSDERIQAGLTKLQTETESPASIHVAVTRTSTRAGTARKRSYRQSLCLKVNGVDLSAIEVKETQSRIENFVDGALLPHAVFFGQHMGAARGLLDSTDRTLKDILALVFPLDVWKEARKEARERIVKLQDNILSSEASLDAAKSIFDRLKSAESSAQHQYDTYERERDNKMIQITFDTELLFSSYRFTFEDSIVFAESFAPSNESKEVQRMIEELQQELRILEDQKDDDLENARNTLSRDLALAHADLESEIQRHSHIASLVRKCEDWEADRKSRMSRVEEKLVGERNNLKNMEERSEIEKNWRAATQIMDECDRKLNDLADILLRQGEAEAAHGFSEQISEIDLAKKQNIGLQEEIVRLSTSLNDIRDRLGRSQELELVRQDVVLDASDDDDGSGIVAIVACEKCLRPFDGDMYTEARSKLQSEASTIEQEIMSVQKESKIQQRKCELALESFRENVQAKRESILEERRMATTRLGKLRTLKEMREFASKQLSLLSSEKENIFKEQNLYLLELIEYMPELGSSDSTENLSDIISRAMSISETREKNVRETISSFESWYREMAERIQKRRLVENEMVSRRTHIKNQIDDLNRLRSISEDLEVKFLSLKSEVNPFAESLRMLNLERSREEESFAKRESEFSRLKDSLEVMKVLDVAFGPRGVPSFVLEEGLLWLEKLTATYLRKLSGGELLLQIRAFSDYKSSSRVEGENKEVISKRVFIRRNDGKGTVRERSLKQLSGGQRRRCSLAFALAFADLIHDRAGFQSSLLVLDELLQSLDEDGRQRVSKILPELLDETRSFRDSVIVVAQDEVPELSELATGGVDVVVREDDQSYVLFENGDELDVAVKTTD